MRRPHLASTRLEPTAVPTPVPGAPPPAPTLAPPPPPVEVTKYCDDFDEQLAGRCTQDGDAGGVCNQVTFACECSEGFGPLQISEDEWSYAGCYEEKRETDAQLTFGDGVCIDDVVPGSVQLTLLDAAEAAMGGSATDYAFVCGSINLLMTLAVPATKAKALESEGFDLGAEVAKKVQEKAASDPEVKKAVEASLGDNPKPQAVAEVAPSKLPPPVAPPGETPVPTTPAPTKVSSIPKECTSQVANAKLAREVKVGDGTGGTKVVCTALSCNTGFVRKQPTAKGTGAVCEAVQDGEDFTCLRDGDCPSGQVCISESCVAPTPAPTKAVQQGVLLHNDFSKNACVSNEDCRVNGDPSATCFGEGENDRECVCSAGFEHAGPALKMCVAAGSTTVPVNILVNFDEGDCTTYTPSAQEETKRILGKLLEGTVTGFTFSCGSTSVAAAVDANRDAASRRANDKMTDVFNNEVQQSSNQDLKNQKSVDRFSVLLYSQCAREYATRTIQDSQSRCQALQCIDRAVLRKVGDVMTCQPVQATRGGDESDDDLTDGEWGGIAVGIVIFIVVVAAVVFFCLRGGEEPAPAKDTEPATV